MGGISDLNQCTIQVEAKSDVRDTLNNFAEKINRQVSKQLASKPPKPKTSYFFSITTKTKHYDFKCKSAEERSEWMEALKNAGCQLQGEMPLSTSNSEYPSSSTIQDSSSPNTTSPSSLTNAPPSNYHTTTNFHQDGASPAVSPTLNRNGTMVATVYTPTPTIGANTRSNSQANLQRTATSPPPVTTTTTTAPSTATTTTSTNGTAEQVLFSSFN